MEIQSNTMMVFFLLARSVSGDLKIRLLLNFLDLSVRLSSSQVTPCQQCYFKGIYQGELFIFVILLLRLIRRLIVASLILCPSIISLTFPLVMILRLVGHVKTIIGAWNHMLGTPVPFLAVTLNGIHSLFHPPIRYRL